LKRLPAIHDNVEDYDDDVTMTSRWRWCRQAVDRPWDLTWEQPSTLRYSARRRLQLRHHLLRDHDEKRTVQLRGNHTQR